MATSATQAEPVSAVKSTLANTIFSLTNRVKTAVNNILPPERRENLKQQLVAFAVSHPVLATLLLAQAVFSGIPLVLFVVLTISVLALSLVAALVIGVLGALLFTVFCVGFGLLVLLPTLFITTFTAVGVWLWGWGVYYIVKWFRTADTEQLTRFSSDLTSQFLGKSNTEDELDQEQHDKQKSTASHDEGETDEDSPEQPVSHSQAINGTTGVRLV
ncbi:hypothetical protein BGW36DRAFT_356489 [Talaromyces proteolyticus]|uniref:Uncharacterized protein n=1 Tax=Talaromyces proteolyticus TaxID=1131652 RepID=A0AAD4PZ88_9EURO|nr:uncharacterized protein BGW36DRAFT_356489 [Talaromyces proteolyticus]KAH8702365.1 hypothetical protein BGW36DRAFT_356489 [Talaromyces proteolyticus]